MILNLKIVRVNSDYCDYCVKMCNRFIWKMTTFCVSLPSAIDYKILLNSDELGCNTGVRQDARTEHIRLWGTPVQPDTQKMGQDGPVVREIL